MLRGLASQGPTYSGEVGGGGAHGAYLSRPSPQVSGGGGRLLAGGRGGLGVFEFSRPYSFELIGKVTM